MKLVTIPETGYEKILTWNYSLKKSDLVYDTFNELLCRSIIEFKNHEVLDQVYELKELSNKSFWRIVTSPDFYQRTIEGCKGNISDLIRFLGASIDVEKFRNGDFARNIKGSWSANGDLFIPNIDHSGEWVSKEIYQAPHLAEQIPLDFNSVYARRNMPVESFRPIQYGKAHPFTKQEKDNTELKIKNAYDKILKSAPKAAQFILNYAKTIVLRKDLQNIETFQSSSCNGYIGQIVLLNPQLPHVDEEIIAESLVHESIHSLMWRAEVLSHIIKNPLLKMTTVKSPWSGYELHYYTILQAAFVWFGIANFWKDNLNLNFFDPTKSRYYFNRAIKGFIDKRFMKEIKKHSYNLSDGMFESFENLSNEALKLNEIKEMHY